MRWEPACSIEALQLRARILAGIRAFFAGRGVMEVETPLLSASTATDPGLASFEVETPGRRFLLTSPEPHMKRLLAAGSGPIYQICRAFRAAEHGGRHNPEFTMLEWYRPGFTLGQLEAELLDLLAALGWQGEVMHEDYGELLIRHAGIDPFEAPDESLLALAARTGDMNPGLLDRSAALDLLFSHCVEPALAEKPAVIVSGYPAAQAALARTARNARGHEVALRFELYLNGLEIANAYDELADPEEQARRARADNAARRMAGLPEIPEDRLFLEAVSRMPVASGIALGVDRLIMVLGGYTRLDQVLAFPFDRA